MWKMRYNRRFVQSRGTPQGYPPRWQRVGRDPLPIAPGSLRSLLNGCQTMAGEQERNQILI